MDREDALLLNRNISALLKAFFDSLIILEIARLFRHFAGEIGFDANAHCREFN